MVATQNRFRNEQNPCPICGGHDRMDRESGARCGGYRSSDERYVYCTNSSAAGLLERDSDSGAYRHYLAGPCRCGVSHMLPARPPITRVISERGVPERIINKIYPYYDETGGLLFEVVRFQPKGFSQRRPARPDDPPDKVKNGVVWDVHRVRRVLYRLPELCAADPTVPVLLVEGEKDVERLHEAGLVATCNPMGAGKWDDNYTVLLAGRTVIILPDNDPPGHDHAAHVAACLAGVAAHVAILELPDLPEHGDVSDWLTTHTIDELHALIAPLLPAPPETPPPPEPPYDESPAALDVVPPNTDDPAWLYAPYLLRGSIAALVGTPGSGKSFLALHFAARISQRTPVIYAADERGLAKRLAAWHSHYGGALSGLHLVHRPLDLADATSIQDFCAEIAPVSPALIVLDNLARVTPGLNPNSPKNAHVLMTGLTALRDQTGACVLLTHDSYQPHMCRDIAPFAGLCETVLGLVADDEGVRLTCTKQRDMPPFPDLLLEWLDVAGSRVPQAIRSGAAIRVMRRLSAADKVLLALDNAIFTEHGARATELHVCTHLASSTFYKALGQLKEAGHLAQDAKGIRYFLTPDGKEVLTKIQGVV